MSGKEVARRFLTTVLATSSTIRITRRMRRIVHCSYMVHQLPSTKQSKVKYTLDILAKRAILRG